MSHLVTIKTRVTDTVAVAAACRRLGLPEPTHGTAELFSGNATGLLVQFPEWQYPVVIDVSSGELRYDNYEGRWGDPGRLDAFLQMYAVERAKLAARVKGYQVHEQALEDGSIKVTIDERVIVSTNEGQV